VHTVAPRGRFDGWRIVALAAAVFTALRVPTVEPGR
jgi:hypothetical protein